VQITRKSDFKLGSEKIRCYMLRALIGKGVQELWVDKQRFLILQRRQKIESGDASEEIRIKTTSIEINQPIADSMFRFEPGKEWSQLESLLLPSEESVLLTGAPAANFSLKTLDGELTELSQACGKVVALDFRPLGARPAARSCPPLKNCALSSAMPSESRKSTTKTRAR
jgi:hypothetical protein